MAPRPGAWRLITGYGDRPSGPVDGPEAVDGPANMALDQALLESVSRGGVPTLRLYTWSPPTLSFGRNQPARDLYDEDAAARQGIAFVRRPTGGQAVLHDDELTYAVAAPVSVIGKPRAAYERINRALVAGLKRLGVDAALEASGVVAGRGGAEVGDGPDWMAACFRRPARGEVVVGGAKLVGSAQRMEARSVLQHGSILLGGSQGPAEALLVERSGGVGAGPPGWTTLERELGRRPSVAELIGAVRDGFADVMGIELAPSVLDGPELRAARDLRPRFASSAWTWRR